MRKEPLNNDWPIHEKNTEYSSIGPSWPPTETSHKRIKGFYPHFITNFDSFIPFINQFNSLVLEDKITRISLRTLVKTDFLKQLPDEYKPLVEIIIPLDGAENSFDEYCLVYFGKNHPSRKSKNPIEEDVNRLDQALKKESKDPEKILNNVNKNGYQLKILSSLEIDESIITQIHQLIERFGYDLETTRNMLQDQNFTIGVAIKDEKIVSVSIAEKSVQKIDDRELKIVELTEASTDKNHLSNGLYSAISTLILIHLANKPENEIPHLVFGECNGASAGVLHTAKYQNRRFAFENIEKFGFSLGYLPKHVPILGPDEINSPEKIECYNNLFPAYLTREILIKYFLN